MDRKEIKEYLMDNYIISESDAEDMSCEVANSIDYSVIRDLVRKEVDDIAESEGLKAQL